MTLELYWLQICPYYDSRVVIYDRKMFIRMATGIECGSALASWLWHATESFTLSLHLRHRHNQLFELFAIDWLSVKVENLESKRKWV